MCVCGAMFSVERALSCPKSGFPSIRQNKIRDLTANLLTEVCSDVCIEPDLQPVSGEALTCPSSNIQDGAQLDIPANGFWGGRFERTYFDILVFNPHAPSNRKSCLSSCYGKHGSLKKSAYEQRQRNRKCIFHPFSSLGHWSKRSHNLLQTTSLMSGYEMGPITLLHHILATLLPNPLSSVISHPVH